MAERTLVQKLGIKPGFTLLILNAPEGYLERLSLLPDGVTVHTEGAEGFDFVQLFVFHKADIDEKAAFAAKALKPGGLLWYSYPKKTGQIKTDISRDTGWQAVSDMGLDGVTQISIDETWSALRFRPAEEIVYTGKRKPPQRKTD